MPSWSSFQSSTLRDLRSTTRKPSSRALSAVHHPISRITTQFLRFWNPSCLYVSIGPAVRVPYSWTPEASKTYAYLNLLLHPMSSSIQTICYASIMLSSYAISFCFQISRSLRVAAFLLSSKFRFLCLIAWLEGLSIFPNFIGELAPLLSVLGHEMHKRHKCALRFLARLGCCAVSFSLGVPCQFLVCFSSSNLSTYQTFNLTMCAFQCKYKCSINLAFLFYSCFLELWETDGLLGWSISLF